jgi:DNA-directed RNA polymerase specialized sigma24 family protein
MSLNANPPATTVPQWSVVLKARRQDTDQAMEAMARLGEAYWYPLYAYVRQRGHPPEEAKNLAHEFFARLFQNKTLSYMKRDCGKFRSFLLSAMNHFLTDEWRKGRLVKPAAPPVSPAPEKIFEQNWALAVLNVVYDRLKREYQEAGNGELFTEIKFSIIGRGEAVPYADLARRWSVAEETLRQQVQDLRRRFGQVLREEVAALVATPAEMEEELRCLFHAVPLESAQ